MVASRILGYGKDYDFVYDGESYVIDLSILDNKPFDESLITERNNSFKLKRGELHNLWQKAEADFVPS